MELFRSNMFCLIKSFEKQYVTSIIGPRRVGKSFFTKWYMSNHADRKWVALNMDVMVQRQRIAAEELKAMIEEGAEQLIGKDKKIWVVIDEAQKAPEIFDQIKVIYDDYKDQDAIKFIITGSAILSLHKYSAETLAGRVELHHMHEFNLREAVKISTPTLPTNSIFDVLFEENNFQHLGDLVKTLSPFKKKLTDSLTEHVVWGGFPEMLPLSTKDEKINYLNNYLQTYLEKDIRAIETITDLNLYRNLLEILAEQTGSLRDDERIVNALNCKRETLNKYRGYVAATLLFQNISPYINSSLKRLVKSPKGYLLANGLISILTGIVEADILIQTGLVGHRFENWFLNELNIWTARTSLPQKINFWRTSSNVEVDFVVIRNPFVLPIEITYSKNILSKKVRNLEKFLAFEPKAKWGLYIYQGDFVVDKEKKIIFFPAWAVG